MRKLLLCLGAMLGVAGIAQAQTLTIMRSVDGPHYDAQRTTWSPTADIGCWRP